jgi:hypothetical protein
VGGSFDGNGYITIQNEGAHRQLRHREGLRVGSMIRRPLLLTLTAALVAMPGCKSAAMGATSHACALGRYWADTSGTVADPDSGVTTQTEVVDLAREACRTTPARLPQFVQLYDNLSGNMSDSEYAAEATAFETNCPT